MFFSIGFSQLWPQKGQQQHIGAQKVPLSMLPDVKLARSGEEMTGKLGENAKKTNRPILAGAENPYPLNQLRGWHFTPLIKEAGVQNTIKEGVLDSPPP